MKKQPDFNETMSLQQYRGSIDFLKTHIQLLDASLIQILKILEQQVDQELYINQALNLDIKTYDKLNHPLIQKGAIINHSKKKNIEFAIVRLFNDFTSYLQSITKEMYSENPMLVVGKAVVSKDGEDNKNITMSYAEIVRLGNYENLKDRMVRNIFRSIENSKSTDKLLERIIKDTKVEIPQPTKDDALTYLEMRHLFIHNRGVVDEKYAKDYGKNFTPNLKEKQELPTKFEIFTKATLAITKLVTEMDRQLIENGIVKKREHKSKNTTT